MSIKFLHKSGSAKKRQEICMRFSVSKKVLIKQQEEGCLIEKGREGGGCAKFSKSTMSDKESP
jgi:transcriptional regulator CtsR